MKKNLFLLAAMLLVSTVSFADRVLPRPQASVPADGEEQYFYNVEYAGFLVGANDWGTRASVARDKGLKIRVSWVGETYKLGAMSPDNAEGVWIDGSRQGNDQFGFNYLENGFNIINTKFPDTFLTWTGNEDNTRLNFTASATNGTWYAVTEEEFNHYMAEDLEAAKVYFAALPLKDLLEKSQEYGIDDSSERAVYNNPDATVEQLNDAIATLSAKISEYEKTHINWSSASVANPLDITEALVINPQPTSAQGWTIVRPYGGNGPMLGSAAFEYWAGNASNRENASFKYYQKIDAELPQGIYRVSANCAQSLNGEPGAIWKTPSAGVFGADGDYMYTDLVKEPVDDCANEATRVKLSAIVPYFSDGEFSIGVASVRRMDGRWFVASNFQLEYLGNGEDAVALALSKLIDEAQEYFAENMDYMCDEYYGEAAYGLPEWEEALDNGTADDKSNAMKAADAWLKKAKLNISYFEQVQNTCSEYTLKLDAVEQLGQEYEVVSASRELIAVIMAKLESLEMTNEDAEEFLAKAPTLVTQRMYIIGTDDDMANATPQNYLYANDLIQNRECNGDKDGWSSKWAHGGTYDMTNYPCGEVYQATFDKYQVIKGLPQGTYEFSCQGLDRRGNWADEVSGNVIGKSQGARIYAFVPAENAEDNDSLSVAIPFARSGWCDEKPDGGSEYKISGLAGNPFEGKNVPNNMVSAGAWFQAGYYQTGAIRIYVEEGQDIVIGVRKDAQLGSGNWTVVGNFTCYYLGPDDNAGTTPTVNREDPLPTVTLNSAGYATFSSNVATNIAASNVNVKAYKASVEGETITLTQLTGYIPAGTGVVLYGETPGAKVEFVAATSGTPADVTGNCLKATTQADGKLAEVEANSWALGNENMFLAYTGNTYFYCRAYLVHEKSAESKMRIVFADETNGIVNAAIETAARNGKLLENGKVVIVKNGMKYNVAGQAIK